MTIRDIAVAFGFDVDQKSVNTAENTIKNIKSFATKALGAIAIGFSFSALNSIAEEFNGINDEIKAATKEMGDQEDIQQRILKAANDTKSSYSDMAGFVTQLVKQDENLFGDLDTATEFASLTTKVLKTAGRADSEVSSAQTMLNKAFAEGSMSAATFTKMLKSYPEMINTMADGLGVTKDQLSAMAEAGQITSETLVTAFSGAADTINSDFDELDYSISDAMTNIRNSWGLFVNDLWVGSGITNGVGKMMVRAFNGFLDVLKKLQPYIERVIRFLLSGVQKAMDLISRVSSFIGRLVNKIGGIENALKLVAIVAGAIWLALNASKILSFLKTAKTLLAAVNLKVLAIIAVIVILALIIEDFINFMLGNDSVIGTIFDKMGIGAENARQMIVDVWKKVTSFLSSTWDWIKNTANRIFKTVKTVIGKHMGSIKKSVSEIWDGIVTILSVVWDNISGLAEICFGALLAFFGGWELDLEGIFDLVVSAVDGLLSILGDIGSWISEHEAVMDVLVTVLGSIAAAIGIVRAALLVYNTVAAIVSTVSAIMAGGFSAASVAGGVLAGVIGFITSPITIAVAAIAALIAIGVLLYKNWDTIKAFAINIWNAICDFFKNVLNGIAEFFVNIWNGISSFISGIWEGIKGLFSTALNFISSLISSIMNGISNVIQTIWNAISGFISGIMSGISSAISGIWNTILSVISTVLNAIHSVVSSIWSGIQSVTQSVWNGISSFISGIWSAITGAISTAVNTVHSTITSIFNSIKSTVTSIVTGIKDTVTTTFTNIVTGISTTVGKVKDTVVNGFTAAIDWIKGLPSQALQWGSDIISGIADGIKGAISKVTDAVSGVADKIKSFLHFSVPDEGPLTDFQSWMPDFMGGLAEGIGDSEDTLMDKVKGVASGISTLMQGATANVSTAASGAVSNTSNTTVTQNNTFNNSYSGSDTQAQQNVSKGMNKSAQDATTYMAKGLAYAR